MTAYNTMTQVFKGYRPHICYYIVVSWLLSTKKINLGVTHNLQHLKSLLARCWSVASTGRQWMIPGGIVWLPFLCRSPHGLSNTGIAPHSVKHKRITRAKSKLMRQETMNVLERIIVNTTLALLNRLRYSRLLLDKTDTFIFNLVREGCDYNPHGCNVGVHRQLSGSRGAKWD